MLNFRTTNIVFISLALVAIVLASKNMVHWLTLLPLLIVYSLVLFYGSYYVGSNFFMKVLCKRTTTKKQIAISFDDGPVEAYTTEILDLLKTANVPAAFFCIGKNIAGREAILQRIIAEGHVIGNHSYSHHFWFDLFSAKKMKNDLEQMNETVKNVTGLLPKLFRPPYGVTTPNMRKATDALGVTAIGWNIRSMDTVIKEEDKLFDKVSQQLQPGSIVLLHDTSKATLTMLPRFIEAARDKGYEFVRVDKLLNVSPYA
ncbi:MAG: polysaccharide deacetylase family protein [Chitinophagaceae bacterium]